MFIRHHIRIILLKPSIATAITIVGLILIGTLASCAGKSQADTTDEQSSDVVTIPVGNAPSGTLGYRDIASDFVLPGTYDTVFFDINSVQLKAAKQLGFKPIASLSDAYHMKCAIVRVNNCDEFIIDPLTHSVPYLVPEAAKLLKDIGRAFKDSIKSRTGRTYRIRTTSLTRTRYTVSNLITVNGNATENSCHCYGTTFDLSWARFDCQDGGTPLDEGQMKLLLAEILFKMREEGRCYVLHEHNQSCFHITTRPHQKNSIKPTTRG